MQIALQKFWGAQIKNNGDLFEERPNPSDVVTTGVLDPLALMKRNNLVPSWDKRPKFLEKPDETWDPSVSISHLEKNEEVRQNQITIALSHSTHNEIITRFSSFDKLLSVVGWLNQFLNNATKKHENRTCTPFITVKEIRETESRFLKIVQSEGLETDLQSLRSSGSVAKNSKI